VRAAAVPLTVTEAHATFRAIVDRLPDDNHQLRAFLARAVPLEAKAGTLHLAYAAGEPFVDSVLRETTLVERLASEYFGAPTTLTVERDSPRASGMATLATMDAEEEERKRRAALAKVKNHPRVADALEVLGARVKELKLGGH
jgi:hypothetical protein